MTDLVATAAADVYYDAWVNADDGEPIPQSSAPSAIQAMVRLLDLRPGMKLLEVGTGTGYSGALLAQIVGASGQVVSLDVDGQLACRAAKLHERAGHRQVEVHPADGIAGWPPAASYDRIVSWATPHVLPQAWINQLTTDGLLVTPVKIAPVASANAVLRCRIVSGQPYDGTLHPGSFIEMAPDVITDFGTPVRYVDGVRRNADDEQTTWISATRLRDQPHQLVKRLLSQLEAVTLEPDFIDAADRGAFTAFLLAITKNPASVGTARGWGLGVAELDSIAVVTPRGGLLTVGSNDAADQLHTHYNQWRQRGKPGYDDLTATYTHDSDGWIVRPQYCPSA